MKIPGGILGKSSEADSETAHVILEKLGDVSDIVTTRRVIFASIVALLIALASVFSLIWVIPYENVDVEVVYMQAGSGHVVLVELDNKGSRAIEDVSLTIRFLDSEGSEIDRHDFYLSKLPAHSSISNTPSDDLELIVLGKSVWDDYFIEITLEYIDNDSQRDLYTWTHEVGDWTRESFVDQTPFELF
ncbi:MAG: hypothetical protein L7R66_03710 [Candidatus Thalassarchaeaceae archaeon]|nr:hypothetical protein [Candidatus Thalassarchaeaceae archaeon]